MKAARLTNDPDLQRALIEAAPDGEALVALRRPGDLVRDRLIGRHARASAMDETFFGEVATYDARGVLKFALLQNPELRKVPHDQLVEFVGEELLQGANPETITGYVFMLVEVVPGFEETLCRFIERGFVDNRWTRSQLAGRTASELYFALSRSISPYWWIWLTSKGIMALMHTPVLLACHRDHLRSPPLPIP